MVTSRFSTPQDDGCGTIASPSIIARGATRVRASHAIPALGRDTPTRDRCIGNRMPHKTCQAESDERRRLLLGAAAQIASTTSPRGSTAWRADVSRTHVGLSAVTAATAESSPDRASVHAVPSFGVIGRSSYFPVRRFNSSNQSSTTLRRPLSESSFTMRKRWPS